MLFACLIVQLVAFVIIGLVTNCTFYLRWPSLYWIIFIISAIMFFVSSITGIVLILI